ncbi:hypothetical protein H8S95_06190 [Pontibacter sp. KCTC 32443]|uniref:glycine zipper domain-containing protein n=1 Tax=Pontibacter TaxID=323449 RepID=UPI00164DAE6E|nr:MULTISPECIES: glycine zipper domain-containing protein [Pontibacter]MBC5773645.1 hypothetical protein [Pontibacter sp. KCTC 32443]
MKANYLINKAASLFLLVLFLVVFAHQTIAQSHNQISRGLNLYVYPAKGQSNEQQQKDESECYNWAIQQTGLNPANMPKVQGAAPTETSSTGEALKGGAAGAAAGAAIGAIVGGGAGEGAAIGGITGVIAGRRRGKKQEKAEQQQIQASVSAQEQENWSRYIRAFSGCIEGKGYTIK